MIYKLIMLFLLLCFYSAYFAKQVMLKRHGISTNRLARGTKPKKTQRTEICLLAAVCAGAAVQLLSTALPETKAVLRTPAAVRICGVLAVLCGTVLFICALAAMKDSWRAGIDETQETGMVSGGIYKFSRNPAFAGFDLIYAGTAMVFPGIAALLSAGISVTLFHLQILEEEKYLTRKFGSEYEEYKKNTPRYLLF